MKNRLLPQLFLISILLLFIWPRGFSDNSVKAVDPFSLINSPFGITSRNDNQAIVETGSGTNWDNLILRIKMMHSLGVKWDRLFVSTGDIFLEDGSINQEYLDYLDQVMVFMQDWEIKPYILLNNSSAVVGAGGKCDSNIENDANWPYDLWHSPPKNWDKWQEYLETLVLRYGKPGRNIVKHWEISFEENLEGCPFAQNPQLYVDFFKNTRKVIKNLDPEAKIILGRLLPANIAYLNTILDLGIGQDIDIISVGGPYQCSGAANLVVNSDKIMSVLAQHGLTKDIWFTEVVCVSDIDLDGITDETGLAHQADFVNEIYTRGLTIPSIKIFFQSLIDRLNFVQINKSRSGLFGADISNIRPPFSPKPAAGVYQDYALDYPEIATPSSLLTTNTSLAVVVNRQPVERATDYKLQFSQNKIFSIWLELKFIPRNPKIYSLHEEICQKG